MSTSRRHDGMMGGKWDMAGKMGSRYQFLRRRIQRICVDVCNEQGCGIPFTQITLHQAG